MSDEDSPAVRLAGPARHLARPRRRPLADDRQPGRHRRRAPRRRVGRPPLPPHRPHRAPSPTGFVEEAWTHDRGRHGGQRGADGHPPVLDAVPGPARAATATRPSGRRSGTPTPTTWASTPRSRRAERSGSAIACTPASTSLATGGLAATCRVELTDGSIARKACRIMPSDAPLRIALLSYRGKPHVGGQGVYTRHLAKALVDLGHHVEVLGGQPYPILDERVPLVELPSLDIYNDHFPMRMPGLWELKNWTDFVEVTAFSLRHLPGAARLLHAGLGPPPPPPGRLRHRPGQPVPRLRPAPHRAPARPAGPRHDPPPDHRRPPPRDGGRGELVQAAHAAPLVRLRRHADAGRPPARADHHGVGELLQGHRPRPQGRPRPHGGGPGGRRHRPLQAAARGRRSSPAASSPPRRPTWP